jgi:hypothetical protein
VQWLDLCVSMAAGGDLALAAVSCVWLAGYARASDTAARRAGAGALALVNAGLALEAALFLAMAAPATDGSTARILAVVLVRGVLLGSSALMALLLLRSTVRR